MGGGVLNAIGIGAIYSFTDLGSEKMRRAQVGVTQLGRSIDTIAPAAARMEMGLKQMVGGLGPLAAGTALVAWPLLFAKHAGKFESDMLKVGQVARASSEDFARLKASAISIGMTTSKSASEAAAGMYELASAGFDTNTVLQTIGPVLQLSTVSGEAFGEMADVTTTALRAFNLEAGQTEHITDSLIRLQQVSKFHYSEMGAAIGQVAGVAAGMNQRLETTMAWLGLFRNAGLSAEYSAFKLKMTLNSLVNPKTVKIADALGVSLTDKEGKYKSLNTIMADLVKATNKYNDAEVMAISRAMFGARNADIIFKARQASYTSVENGVSTVYKGVAAAQKFEDEIIHSQGLTKEFAAERQKLLVSQIAIMKNRMSAFAQVIGERALPMVTQWFVSINKTILAMTKWVKENPRAVDAIIRLTGWLGKGLVLWGAFKISLGATNFLLGGTSALLRGIPALLQLTTMKWSAWTAIIRGTASPIGAVGTNLQLVLGASAVAMVVAIAVKWYEWNKEIEKTNRSLKAAQANEERLMELTNLRLRTHIKSETAATALRAGRLAVQMGIKTGSIQTQEQAAKVYADSIRKSLEAAAAVKYPELRGELGDKWVNDKRIRGYIEKQTAELTPRVLEAGLADITKPLGIKAEIDKKNAETQRKAQAEADERTRKLGQKVTASPAPAGKPLITGPSNVKEITLNPAVLAEAIKQGRTPAEVAAEQGSRITTATAATKPTESGPTGPMVTKTQHIPIWIGPGIPMIATAQATEAETPTQASAKTRKSAEETTTGFWESIKKAEKTKNELLISILKNSLGKGDGKEKSTDLFHSFAKELANVIKQATEGSNRPIVAKIILDGKIVAESVAKQEQETDRRTGQAIRPNTQRGVYTTPVKTLGRR